MPALRILAAIAARAERDPAITSTEFRAQWSNPREVIAVLLIIGSEVVQKALAQLTGGVFVPVAFSFGWVAYAFSTIVAMAGDGRLMPEPDYPCKVINVENGYTRENRSWIIGRVLRDSEPALDRESLVVEVFVAKKVSNRPGRRNAGESKPGLSLFFGAFTMVLQLGVAAIPFGLYYDWGVFMITVSGTILALTTGFLPQWRTEKLSCRKNTRKTIAITKGNGSRYVMVIFGCRRGLDLEDLAAGEGPRMKRPWEDHGYFKNIITIPPRPKVEAESPSNDEIAKKAKPRQDKHEQPQDEHEQPQEDEHEQPLEDDSDMSDTEIKPTPEEEKIKNDLPKTAIQVSSMFGLPLDFWMTRAVCLTLTIAWTALLIAVGALDENAWYLFAVGAIGMFQNAFVAGMRRAPEKRGLHLKKIHVEKTGKVMDVLMDIESAYPGRNIGRSLRDEFFPGEPRHLEREWWNGNSGPYDKARISDEHIDRGIPWNQRSDADKIACQGMGRANAARRFLEDQERKRAKAEKLKNAATFEGERAVEGESESAIAGGINGQNRRNSIVINAQLDNYMP